MVLWWKTEKTSLQKKWVNTWLHRDGGITLRAKFGAAVAQDEFMEVGGENVVKRMQMTQYSTFAIIRKKHVFWANMEKLVFGAFLTDDVSMTSWEGPVRWDDVEIGEWADLDE